MIDSPVSVPTRWWLPVLVALALSGCATPGSAPGTARPPGDGRDPSSSVDLGRLHERAAQGDAPAQFELGVFYLHGRGGAPRRPEVAVRWLKRAAAQRHDDAQLLLAVLHQRGEGVPVDLSESFRLARQVADRGHRHGMGLVAESYEHGRGVKPDMAQAIYWYRRAAEAGEPISQTRLGYLYLTGRGVKTDRAQAGLWLERAAVQYHAPAFYILGFMHLGRDGGRADPVAAYQWLLLGEAADPRPNLPARNAKTALEAQLGPADKDRARRQAGEWQSRHPRPAARTPGS
jgi:TPR repeat protein